MSVFGSVGSAIDKKVFSKFFENKGISGGTLLGWGVNAGFGVMTYNDMRKDGHGQVGSAAAAIGQNIMMDVMGPAAYMGLQAVQAAPKMIVKGVEGIGQYARSQASIGRNAPFINSHFNDSQQAYTMRQAGMSLAKASKYNLQQTMLGNEAQYMHY